MRKTVDYVLEEYGQWGELRVDVVVHLTLVAEEKRTHEYPGFPAYVTIDHIEVKSITTEDQEIDNPCKLPPGYWQNFERKVNDDLIGDPGFEETMLEIACGA